VTKARKTKRTKLVKDGTRPQWRDGRLDPEWLGAAGQRFVAPWLRQRLQGVDPWQPIDTRADEDPEAFIVEMIREVGVQHGAAAAIAESTLTLLDEARKLAPEAPSYLPRALRVCQLTRLPHVQPWFAEEVAHLAAHKRARWKAAVQRQILHGAVVQRAGSAGDWLMLLEREPYTTLALLALGETFRKRVEHLPKWWAATRRE
jgi:hypothetical protein